MSMRYTLYAVGVSCFLYWCTSETRADSGNLEAGAVSQQTGEVVEESFWQQYLPQSSIAQRSETDVIHLHELATMIERLPSSSMGSVAPAIPLSLQIIENSPSPRTPVVVQESYAKQWVILAGLFTFLISGLLIDRRRLGETVVIKRMLGAQDEASVILALTHNEAKIAIDSLQGEYKIQVLKAIVGGENCEKEPPIVQVQNQPVQVECV